MTRDDLAALAERWRAVLLPEWRVVLVDTAAGFDGGSDDDFWAICESKSDYTEVRVHLTDECLARSDAEVEVTLVHELLHALTRPWRQQIESVAGAISQDAYRALRNAREHEEEQLVDRLSYIIAGHSGPGVTREPS